MPISVKFICYNSTMDKLAYHLNKKKKPAKTTGKFLYYYPCNEEDTPDVWYGPKAYIVIEVSEAEWEALFELDRLEYNNTHKYQRHTVRFSDKDEDELTPKQRERRIDKSIPFNVLADERRDKEILLANLSQQDRDILEIMANGKTQKEAAELLGVTQGYISTLLKNANCSVDDYIFGTWTREEIVWHCWNKFVNDGEMPYFLDVELEFVLRKLFNDLMPFTHWFYSVGELFRHILTYYYFDNDKMDDEIAEYLRTSSEEDKKHYEDYYGDQPPIVGAVYIRLCKEMERRKRVGLHDSDKLYTNIFAAVEKITSRLNIGVEEFLTKRFYPYIAKWRNKRIRQFYKAYSGKSLPK